MRELPLARLRAALWEAGLGVTTGPEHLATGWESTIWKSVIAGELMAVKVFAPDRSGATAAREARAMRALTAAGYPVPAVHHVEPDPRVVGAPFLVMDLIDGTSLFEAGVTPRDVGAVNGELMAQLHLLEPGHFPASHSAPLSLDTASRAAEQHPDLAPVAEWLSIQLEARSPIPPTPVHRDLHPGNILIDRHRQPWVIDWTGFEITEPALDTTWTRLLGEMYAERAVVEAFSAAYRRFSPAPFHDPVAEVVTAVRRIADVAFFLTPEGSQKVQPSAEIRAHLPTLAVPVGWIHRHTGIKIELDRLLHH